MNKFIPLTDKAPIFEQVTTLDGTDFALSFYWNDRCSRWFCALKDTQGTILAAYRKICSDIPFLAHDVGDDLPKGDLWFITLDGSGEDPGLLDLGNNVQLAYISEDNAT